ncbi:HAD hydrolase-like protein [Sphingomonas sp.]|uniref:HAD hydrolase-like protein n=1 Tax=Sphingomonas sp. TaxID=28214 RepID=UPI001E1A8196|nr:HAD hydrolase-like protein [Sphingomonas sp.]MBX9795454.1 HAD hydrolase-like protein [Sphingomonas sp.]
MTATPRYALTIFDFDGTLADSGDWFLSIADDLADRFRFRHVHPDEVEGLRGRTSREVIKHLGIPRWKIPLIARHLHRRLAAETGKIALFAGVPALLETLEAAGVTIALVTSNSEDNVRAILGETNAARIAHWECGASMFGKAPRFRRVIRRARAPLEACLAIGDETRDLTAANKVGIDAAAVLWGYANQQALTALGPVTTFSAPEQVVPFVLNGAA